MGLFSNGQNPIPIPPAAATVIRLLTVSLRPNCFAMNTYLLLFGMGTPEIIIIAIVLLLLFGGRKIPELMKGLGRGIKEFKDASKGVDNSTTTPEQKK